MSKKSIFSKLSIMCLAIVMSLAIIFVGQIGSNAYASYTNTTTVTNSDFKNASYTSDGPYTPESWVVADGSDDAGTEKGVLLLNESRFEEYNTYPGTLENNAKDKNILMIKSKNGATRAGYTLGSSNKITLNADSYYIFKVLVNTDTETNGASIYLTGLDKVYSIEDINTSKQWKTAYFYVATGDYKQESVNIELWLGSRTNIQSKGAVYFDNITVTEYSKDKFLNQVDVTQVYSTSINLKADYNTIAVVDGDFEGDTTEWTAYENLGGDKKHGIGDVSNTDVVGSETAPGLMFYDDNENALYINNKTASYTSYKSTTEYTIKQHSYYKLSAYIKTINVTDGAYFGIKETGDNGATYYYTGITNNSTTTDAYNGYKRFNLYISGSPYKDTAVNIVLGLGKSGSTASGVVAFDNITLTQISYDTYTEYSSKTNSKSVTAYDSSSIKDTDNIKNGAFNFASSDDETTYPIKPNNWTCSDNTSISGIISLNEAHFDAQSYPFDNPGVTGYPGTTTSLAETTNNALAIHAKGNFVSYTSSNITLSANTSYKLSLYAKTQDLDATQGGMNITLVNSNNLVLSRMPKLFSQENWTVYTMYVKVGDDSQTAKLTISLGESQAPATVGTIFVDNVAVESVTDEVFLAAEKTPEDNTITTNLSTIRFNTFSGKDADNLYIPSLLSGEGSEAGVKAGIVDTTDTQVTITTHDGANDSYVLMINNTQDASYKYTSSIANKLEKDKVYKISVWIKTTDISSETENDTENNLYKGANFKLTGLDKTFPGIITATSNGWTQYSYYVKTTEQTTINAIFGLGNDVATTGTAYFDDYEIETMTDGFLLDEVEESDNVLKVVAEEEKDKEEQTTPSNSGINENARYWIIIPSVILAVVLIFAIVSISLRQLSNNKNHKVKVGKSQYNRDLSLNGDVVRRELAAERQEKLDSIKAQKEAINKTIEKNKADYEAALKDESVTAKKEHLFSKYARTRNKLQKDLDRLTSAEKYLNDPANIKSEEQREIKRRQQLLNEKNKQVQNDNKNK